MKHKVILLTGSPGSGKSTLASELKRRFQHVAVFDFGSRLLEYKRETSQTELTYAELRTRSSTVISPEDVFAVDRMLVDYVDKHRYLQTIIINSHAITRETFGFRGVMSLATTLKRIEPHAIFLLECRPQILLERVRHNPQGRIPTNLDQISLHQSLQRAVAVNYSFATNSPLFVLENNTSVDDLVTNVLKALNTLGAF